MTFGGLSGYRREWLRSDLVAGLTTAAVVIPKSMAYATIAGLPIEVGLYTAFVPMLVYAFLGTSRPLSVSTTTTIAILTGAQLAEVVPNGDHATLLAATAMLTLMVGGVLIVAAALRLGFVANFISEPVLVGFKAGIAVVIIVDQLPKILGIHFAKGAFLHNVRGGRAVALHICRWPTLAVGVGTIAALVLIEKFRPRWPAPLIAVAGAIAGAGLLGWQSYGVELVGAIPNGLPPLTLPDLSLAQQLWPGALGIALMSFTETIAAGRAFQANDEPAPRANVELFATGIANAGGALFGSMPAWRRYVADGGEPHDRRANADRRRRDGLDGADDDAAAGAADRPHAARGARRVVIVYSIGLIKPADFRDILQHPPHRIHLGARRIRWRHAARHAAREFSWRSSSRSSRSLSRRQTRRCTCSAASAARTCSGRAPTSTRTTSRFPGYCCCGWRVVCFSSMPNGRAEDPSARSGGQAEGRGARPVRRVRPRIFGAEDADRGGATAARRGRIVRAGRIEPRRYWRQSGAHRSVRRSAANACSSIWKWLWIHW